MARRKWIVLKVTKWAPLDNYISWFITPITMVYDTQITIVNSYWATGLYKPTNITGGLHIVVPGEYLELAMGDKPRIGLPG